MLNRLVQPGGSSASLAGKESLSKIYGTDTENVVSLIVGETIPSSGVSLIYSDDYSKVYETSGATGQITEFTTNPDESVNLVTSNGSFNIKPYKNLKEISNLLGHVTLEFFQTGNLSDDDLLDAAITFCSTSDCKTIQLMPGKKYYLKRTHTVTMGIKFVGDRSGIMQKGAGTNAIFSGDTAAIRAVNPKESAFIWQGPNSTIWFDCSALVTFIGIVFAADGQNWGATNRSQCIDRGTAIKSISNLNVISCVYYGMTNFVVSTGESIFCAYNYGFALDTDYDLSAARDVIRIISCHCNPNVIRPGDNFIKGLITDNRIFIKLTNHDGAEITDCHTFAVKRFIKNTTAAGYLGMLNISDCLVDRTGCFLENDTVGGAINISNIFMVGDCAGNYNSSAADTDSGFFILRKSTAGQITPIFIANFWGQVASGPYSFVPLFGINFQTDSGYMIRYTGLTIYGVTAFDNGMGIYCQSGGEIVSSSRVYSAKNIYTNLIPNPGWANRIPANQLPAGWTLNNVSITAVGSKRFTATAANGYIYQRWWQRMTGTRTIIVTATSVGSSTGISLINNPNGGSPETITQGWVKQGSKYWAILTTSTDADVHELRIDAGDIGSAVNFEYAAMVYGTIFDFSGLYSEVIEKPNTSGVGRYPVLLTGGTPHSITSNYAANTGVYRIFIAGTTGVASYRVAKLTATGTPTITPEDVVMASGVTYTVTWPDNANPTILCSASGNVSITVTGSGFGYSY